MCIYCRCKQTVKCIAGHVQVIIQISKKLQVLHKAGFCHRDLKPGNCIWLPSQNTWSLIDFGCTAACGVLPIFTMATATTQLLISLSCLALATLASLASSTIVDTALEQAPFLHVPSSAQFKTVSSQQHKFISPTCIGQMV
jgi:serine/threonine protein kinase